MAERRPLRLDGGAELLHLLVDLLDAMRIVLDRLHALGGERREHDVGGHGGCSSRRFVWPDSALARVPLFVAARWSGRQGSGQIQCSALGDPLGVGAHHAPRSRPPALPVASRLTAAIRRQQDQRLRGRDRRPALGCDRAEVPEVVRHDRPVLRAGHLHDHPIVWRLQQISALGTASTSSPRPHSAWAIRRERCSIEQRLHEAIALCQRPPSAIRAPLGLHLGDLLIDLLAVIAVLCHGRLHEPERVSPGSAGRRSRSFSFSRTVAMTSQTSSRCPPAPSACRTRLSQRCVATDAAT